VNHHTRRAKIRPAFFGIVGDVDAAGADVPAAVELEPARRREFENVDIVAPLNIFQHWTVAHHARRYMLQVLRSPAPFGNEFHGAQILRHAEAQTEPFGRAEGVNEHAVSFRITFHVIEQYRRRAAALIDDIRNTADF